MPLAIDDPRTSGIAALLRAHAVARLALDAAPSSVRIEAMPDQADAVIEALARFSRQAGRAMPTVTLAGDAEADLVVATGIGETKGWRQDLRTVLASPRHGAVVEVAVLPENRGGAAKALARLARRFGPGGSSGADRLPSRGDFALFVAELGWEVRDSQLLLSTASRDVCIFRLGGSSVRTEPGG